MRNALVVFAVVLLAATVPAPVSSATKYKPCTLIATKDIETALGAKLITGPQGMLEDENIDDEGPLKGEPVDLCIWKLTAAAGAGNVGGVGTSVVLWITRAIGPLQQLATFWYPPKEELVRQGGGTIESVKLPGAECRIFKNLKLPKMPAGHQTWCLMTSKGMALSLEADTFAKTPFAAQVVKKLLDRAASHLP